MPSIRRHASVALPDHVFRVVKRDRSGAIRKVYYFYQERRGRPDKGPLIRLPDDLHDPLFWQKIEEIRRGAAGPADGTFAALIEHYKARPRYTGLAAKSVEAYDLALERVAAAWGSLLVSDLRPKHNYALLDEFADRPSAGNLMLAVLRTLLAEGVRAEYCPTNVARDVEKMDEAAVGSEPWPETVYAFVLKNAPILLMRAAVLGRATGQRASDLVRIRPADRSDGGFNIRIQKIGNVRHWAPVTQAAWQIISGWSEEPMRPYLNIGGRAITAERLQDEWRAYRKLHPADIPADITLHDLRAAAVCDRRVAGVPHQQIAAKSA